MSAFDIAAARLAFKTASENAFGDTPSCVYTAVAAANCLPAALDEIERLRARIELLEKMIATEDWIREVATNADRKALEDEAE